MLLLEALIWQCQTKAIVHTNIKEMPDGLSIGHFFYSSIYFIYILRASICCRVSSFGVMIIGAVALVCYRTNNQWSVMV